MPSIVTLSFSALYGNSSIVLLVAINSELSSMVVSYVGKFYKIYNGTKRKFIFFTIVIIVIYGFTKALKSKQKRMT